MNRLAALATVVLNTILFIDVMLFVVPWLMVFRLISRIRGTEVIEHPPGSTDDW